MLHFPFLTVRIIYDHILAEDLDQTLEAPGERMSPKGHTDSEVPKQEVQASSSSFDMYQYQHLGVHVLLYGSPP